MYLKRKNQLNYLQGKLQESAKKWKKTLHNLNGKVPNCKRNFLIFLRVEKTTLKIMLVRRKRI